MREKILLGGTTNSGKTLNLIQLAIHMPDRQVWIFDSEGDVNMTLEDFGLELPNLTVVNVTPDWEALTEAYHRAKEVLTPDDWCCFDMMGVFWDLARNAFSRMVFGESPAQHILRLRQEAQSVNFGGFDGLQDWTVIKRMHNEDIFDDAVRWSEFNVMATTSLADYSAMTKPPKTGVEGLIYKEFGMKFEGEKHNKYRFRTMAVIYHDIQQKKYCYKLVKVKGEALNPPLETVDITGRSFFEAYAEKKGLEL